MWFQTSILGQRARGIVRARAHLAVICSEHAPLPPIMEADQRVLEHESLPLVEAPKNVRRTLGKEIRGIRLEWVTLGTMEARRVGF